MAYARHNSAAEQLIAPIVQKVNIYDQRRVDAAKVEAILALAAAIRSLGGLTSARSS
jgi:hypothetical protein